MPSQPSDNLLLELRDDNHADVLEALVSGRCVVSCLCAQWCGTCGEFRGRFAQLAQHFPALQFVWIDIEDQAAVVGELDIDNFPTLLIQQHDIVNFFGTVLPDQRLAERLVQSLLEQTPQALAAQAATSPQRQEWQQTCNLRQLLEQA